ncbi:HdeD family acid-resistance protein [Nocardia sp. NPDC052278]|uniref:HdeD family acid-resistance protein n=1 Tax=unclassified Nocardia TaxID=2637762 RepID=UPI0036A4F2D8
MPENESAGLGGSLADGARPAVLVAGIGSVVLGVLIAVWPDKTERMAELLFGLYLLVSGAIQLIIAIGVRFGTALRMFVFFSGVTSLALAVMAFHSANSILLLAVWIGLGWSVRGIAQATVAVWADELPEGGWQEIFGLLTMMVGFIMIALPFDSLDVLGMTAGGCAIVIGMLEILTVARGRGEVDPVGAARRIPAAPN